MYTFIYNMYMIVFISYYVLVQLYHISHVRDKSHSWNTEITYKYYMVIISIRYTIDKLHWKDGMILCMFNHSWTDRRMVLDLYLVWITSVYLRVYNQFTKFYSKLYKYFNINPMWKDHKHLTMLKLAEKILFGLKLLRIIQVGISRE